MDFQRLLLDIGNSLSKEDVKALAFLCIDFLGRNPASVESASDLFSRLAIQDLLSPKRPHLLAELLVTIHRTRLVRQLNLPDGQFATNNLISPYRKLLYNLSEEITDDDLKQMKFLLNKTLPRRKLEENVTTLEVFVEMERMDHLSDTNLNKLETIIQSVCPVLKEKINQFKALQKHQTSCIAKETGQPMSVSFQSNQGPESLHHEMTASCQIAALEPSPKHIKIHSNISLDEGEALSQQLSGLSTETSSSGSLNVRSDLVEIPHQENQTITGKQMSETAHTNNEVLGLYRMTSAKRGVCLIINNYNFKNLKKREGTMIDEKCLHDVFDWLGFEIEAHHDCTREKMLSLLRTLGSRDHSQMDSVVCCILSHGQQGSVHGADGHTVDFRELSQPLNGLKCSSLADKPKLFFIQACQGTSEQQAVYIESDDRTNTICSDAVALTESIPSDADFLFAMSTLPSFVSFRERKNGSWFIQSLCQNLVQLVPRGCDLVSILTKVNADVSKKTDSTGVKKQMPQPAFTLRKKVVFPVPQVPPPSLPSV